MPDFKKGDFTQQGVAGHVNSILRLNEKRYVYLDLTSNEEAEGCTISGAVADPLNNEVYPIGAGVSGNIEITENGENINVAQYATASVAVPNPSTGKINITTLDEVNVTDYAAAQVVDRNLSAENIKKDVEILGITGTFESGGATWTTVAEEQTGTTVYNSGVNLYFLQLSDVTDFGSPVIKVTHDNDVYYCYWDIDNACWHDTMGTIVVAANIFGGVAYWGVAKSSDTAVTTHTAKIEADTSYSILYDITGTPTNWFITTDIGSTIPTPRNMIAQYGCTISTYMGTQVVTFDKAYAVVTHAVS